MASHPPKLVSMATWRLECETCVKSTKVSLVGQIFAPTLRNTCPFWTNGSAYTSLNSRCLVTMPPSSPLILLMETLPPTTLQELVKQAHTCVRVTCVFDQCHILAKHLEIVDRQCVLWAEICTCAYATHNPICTRANVTHDPIGCFNERVPT